MKKSRFIRGCLAVAMIILLSACSTTEESWSAISDDNTIKIAILGDEEYIQDNGGMEAVELAAEDFRERTGLALDAVIYNDEADYNLSISRAHEIADDPSIAAVIVKQELDYIDATAEIFENAQKPFILTAGCYERTIDKQYQYMIVDCLNAQVAGSIMARYVADQGYQYVAFCHSDTEYEEDELKGFQAEISGTAVRLADTVVGPYTQEEFDIAYARWQALGIEAICISDYNVNNSDLIRMLREKGSGIPVIGDYMMDTDEEIECNGRFMNGTAIVAMYVNSTSVNNQDVKGRFSEKYGMEMSEKAILSYDIISILGDCASSGADSPAQLVDNIKALDGYEGISGTVAFDSRNCLIPNGDEILIFRDGAFQQPGTEK